MRKALISAFVLALAIVKKAISDVENFFRGLKKLGQKKNPLYQMWSELEIGLIWSITI